MADRPAPIPAARDFELMVEGVAAQLGIKRLPWWSCTCDEAKERWRREAKRRLLGGEIAGVAEHDMRAFAYWCLHGEIPEPLSPEPKE